MSVKTYGQILTKLLALGFLTNRSLFHIYGLGEPMLHPQLEEVLLATGQAGLHTSISTNASVVPDKIGEAAASAVSRILISMPGFSQSSYDRIHGFSFKKIKANILRLRDLFPKVPFDMTYHIYQFSLDEMEAARQFCRNHQIRFAPNYAVLFDRKKCLEYVEKRISSEEMNQILSDLIIEAFHHQIRNAPRDFCDFIQEYLSINVQGDVRLCNSFRRDQEWEILCGNILQDNPDDILRRKCSKPFCDRCMKAGLTFAEGYDCKVFPNFYFSLMRENEYLWDYAISDPISTKRALSLMYQVRQWEQEHFSSEALSAVLNVITKGNFSFDEIREIVCRYARFGENTYDRLLPYLTA